MDLKLYKQGCKDGIGIALGYLSVSFTFGTLCVASNVSILDAVLISLLNLTSAGQFSGLSIMLAHGSYLELVLSQLVINIRYALMSLSLSQKCGDDIQSKERMLIAYGITDEIFALASMKEGDLQASYMYGLITTPVIGWCVGTLLGACLMSLLPNSIRDCLGVAIYAMFIAIVIPPTKKDKTLWVVIIISIILSLLCKMMEISSGFAIIIVALIASAICATLFPRKE